LGVSFLIHNKLLNGGSFFSLFLSFSYWICIFIAHWKISLINGEEFLSISVGIKSMFSFCNGSLLFRCQIVCNQQVLTKPLLIFKAVNILQTLTLACSSVPLLFLSNAQVLIFCTFLRDLFHQCNTFEKLYAPDCIVLLHDQFP